jgi:hypothetical protein
VHIDFESLKLSRFQNQKANDPHPDTHNQCIGGVGSNKVTSNLAEVIN